MYNPIALSNTQKKPKHWFKSIHESKDDLQSEPEAIEYLISWTGETFIHTGGTAYWDHTGEYQGTLNIQSLTLIGVTHYRVIDWIVPADR
jgi:hypothetical protein